MRSFLPAITLVCLSCALLAQTNINSDSLQHLLKDKNSVDSVKIDAYIDLSRSHIDNDPKKSLAYADSGLALARHSVSLKRKFPWLYQLKGKALAKQSQYGEAMKFYNDGLQFAIQLKDRIGEARLYNELAIIAEMTSEMVKALELNQKALDIYTEQKDTARIVTVFNNIGIIYMNKKERDKAMMYYKKAIALNYARKNLVANARIQNNIGLIFKELDQHDSALLYFNRALSVLDINKHKFGYALINNNLGITYREMGQYSRALEHFNITKKIQTEINDQFGLALVNDNISQVYFRQGKYKESLAALKEGLVYGKQANNMDQLNTIADHMATTYEKLGDYTNAYLMQKQAKVYDDSLQSKSQSEAIAELEVKYQVKQQQAENDLLKSENELHLSTIKNSNIILIGSIIFSVLILTLLVLAYRSLKLKQKANALIQEKNEKLESLYREVEAQRKSIEDQKDEIERQNVELSMKNEYLLQLNHEKNSLMGIVAHDLRSPLNSIGGITDMLPRLGTLNDGQREFVGLINNVVEGSRTLIQDLMDLSALENKELKIHAEPVSINKLLLSSQKKYAGQAMQKEITLEVIEKTDDALLVLSDSQHIDRILQNLISNALKFSSPGTRVTMGSRIQHDQIQFYITDHGPGISKEDQHYLFKKFVKLTARPTKGESSSGLGLSIVKALVEELRGSIKVESELKKGTTFIISLPIK